MIVSWLENLILLIAGSPIEPVSETLVAIRAEPGWVLSFRGLWAGAPPGRRGGLPDLAARFLWGAAGR